MAGAKLSPRQRMINMMYLVLTALLALNVSKEVLNSFFEVNMGIVKTTGSLSDKNIDTYSLFDNATNQKKVKKYKELAIRVKPVSNELNDFIEYDYQLNQGLDYDKIIIAISGGLDSITLLILLYTCHKYKLVNVHVNHGLHEESIEHNLNC